MAQAFLDKLKDTFPDLEVDVYPDDPKNYQLAHPKGAVLVIYKDRKFNEGQANDGTIQTNTPVFQIIYVTRSLLSKKKNPGAWDILDQGREALNGIDVGHGTANITWEGFFDIGRGGVWMYGQNWKHTDLFE